MLVIHTIKNWKKEKNVNLIDGDFKIYYLIIIKTNQNWLNVIPYICCIDKIAFKCTKK